jgi:hypothetical protein
MAEALTNILLTFAFFVEPVSFIPDRQEECVLDHLKIDLKRVALDKLGK